MRPVTGKEFARALERNGWTLLRISGSHHIYGKIGKHIRISVPIHGNQPLKSGLLRHLSKAADLRVDSFI